MLLPTAAIKPHVEETEQALSQGSRRGQPPDSCSLAVPELPQLGLSRVMPSRQWTGVNPDGCIVLVQSHVGRTPAARRHSKIPMLTVSFLCLFK